MLEKIPHWMGRALARMRSGMDHVVSARPELEGTPLTIDLSSPDLVDGGPIPARYTADCNGGVVMSPPLAWTGIPTDARSLVLVVEDADSPTPLPLVHALAWGISPTQTALAEGAITERSDLLTVGRNSFLKPQWLPPDPPTGHGPHRYVFQLFALDNRPLLGARDGRHALLMAIAPHVIARGLLIATYERA